MMELDGYWNPEMDGQKGRISRPLYRTPLTMTYVMVSMRHATIE